MSKIVLKLIGSGTPNDPYRVDLPCYCVVGEPDLVAKTCLVDVPDEFLDASRTRPFKAWIREKYRGNPKWDRPDVGDDV